jgi:predicted ATPase
MGANPLRSKDAKALAALQSHLGRQSCSCAASDRPTRLIAITGGPGAGKTAILNIAQNLFCKHTAFVPEAASILYMGGFWRLPSENGMKAAQKSIYHIQSQLEAMLIGEGATNIGLCDRGTVDGAAYWPLGAADYWRAMQSTREAELSRYSAVVHLRCPAVDQGFNQSNPARIETAETAAIIDQAIYEAWEGHPRRTVIDSSLSFVTKINHALEAIENYMDMIRHDSQV